MELKTIELVNFQNGNVKIEMEKKNLQILGDNGLGKSRILNAISWVLIDTGADGNKSLEVAPTDDINHEKEVSVSLSFIDKDNQTYLLQKSYLPTYKISNGTGERTFSGMKKVYRINGLELKEKDFNLEIQNRFGANIKNLRTILIPDFLESEYTQAQQREILKSLANTADNQEALLAEFSDEEKEIIKKYSANIEKALNDAKTRAKQKRKDLDKLDSVLEFLRKDILEQEEKQVNDQNLKDELAKIIEQKNNIELLDINTNLNQLDDEMRVKQSEYDRLKTEYHSDIVSRYTAKLVNEMNGLRTKMDGMKDVIDSIKGELNERRRVFTLITNHGKALKNKSFVCPECRRAFEEDEYRTYISDKKMLDTNSVDYKIFNSSLEELLNLQNEIAIQGKNAKEELTKIEDEYVTLQTRYKKVLELTQNRPSAEQLIEKYDNLAKFEDLEETKALIKEIKSLDAKILKEREKVKATRSSETFKALTEEEERLRSELANIQHLAKTLKESNDKLENESKQRESVVEELLEATLEDRVLTRYNTLQNDSLTDSVNANFENVKIQFFDTLVSGEQKTDCKILVRSSDNKDVFVPILSANTASRINARIELSLALRKLWNVSIPILVDNQESVTVLTDRVKDTQVISACVKAGLDTLEYNFYEHC